MSMQAHRVSVMTKEHGHEGVQKNSSKNVGL